MNLTNSDDMYLRPHHDYNANSLGGVESHTKSNRKYYSSLTTANKSTGCSQAIAVPVLFMFKEHYFGHTFVTAVISVGHDIE